MKREAPQGALDVPPRGKDPSAALVAAFRRRRANSETERGASPIFEGFTVPRFPRTLLILSLLLVTSAALGAGHARAAAGRDAWIAAEANALSNRSLSVTCSDNIQDWRRALTAVGFPAKEADEYYGFSLIEQGEMHLSPYVCAGLQLGARSLDPACERTAGCVVGGRARARERAPGPSHNGRGA